MINSAWLTNVAQARKVMFAVIKKSTKLNSPISIQLHLINRMVVPILIYGGQVRVWTYTYT